MFWIKRTSHDKFGFFHISTKLSLGISSFESIVSIRWPFFTGVKTLVLCGRASLKQASSTRQDTLPCSEFVGLHLSAAFEHRLKRMSGSGRII
jgi:hypothetical protein